MYSLAVNLIVRVSGHPWIINEIALIYVDGSYSLISVTEVKLGHFLVLLICPS